MLMTTVSMSPTRLARWSRKKAREPVIHSELGWRSASVGAGIGILTGVTPEIRLGSWIDASLGCEPTSFRRL